MREIVVVQVGQCGIQVGSKLWELLSVEHGINEEGHFLGSAAQKENISTYFDKVEEHSYAPRGIFIDLSPQSIESLQKTTVGHRVHRNKIFSAEQGAANNWAIGRYRDGNEYREEIMDIIRLSAESCDMIQGFQFIHSMGGGTGGGLTSLLLKAMTQEYCDRTVNTFSVFPSAKVDDGKSVFRILYSPILQVSDVIVEPYNAILTMNYLMEHSHLSVVLDNQALFRICSDGLYIHDPRFSDMNALITRAISGISTCFRFPGYLNSDLRKLHQHLVPVPRLHFLATSVAPIWRTIVTVNQMMNDMLHKDNFLADFDLDFGKFLGATAMFRGRLSAGEVEEEMANLLLQRYKYFADWIPCEIKTGVCGASLPGLAKCATFLCNSTAIVNVFRRMSSQFGRLFSRRAFLHWYFDAGVEELEFVDAAAEVRELIEEYLHYQDLRLRDETQVSDFEDDDDD